MNLDNLIDEYVTILDRDPLDHSESTDVILLEFANNSVSQGFLNDWQMDLIVSGAEPTALLKELVQAAGFAPEPQLAGL
jgi:hypothetical protein